MDAHSSEIAVFSSQKLGHGLPLPVTVPAQSCDDLTPHAGPVPLKEK